MQPTERDQYNNINTKFCLQEGYTLFKVEGLNETVELYVPVVKKRQNYLRCTWITRLPYRK